MNEITQGSEKSWFLAHWSGEELRTSTPEREFSHVSTFSHSESLAGSPIGDKNAMRSCGVDGRRLCRLLRTLSRPRGW